MGQYSRPYGPPPLEINGRQYQSFRRGIYPFPCDEAERNRLNHFHKVFLLARNFLLYTRPLPQLPDGERNRILDLGTGTGAWAVQIAEIHPTAEVLGLDLANIQPPRMPRNLRFQVPFDFGSYWFLGEEKPWDLIYLRCALGSVSSWETLYQNIFRRLKPDGVFEQIEIDLQPVWENGRQLPRHHPLQRWYNKLLEATERAGRPIKRRQDIEQLLLSQGFEDVRIEIIRLPITNRPPNYNLKSRTLSEWYTRGLIMSLEAFSLGPFTEHLGWSAGAVRLYIDALTRVLRETSDVRLFNDMYIVTARRPPAPR